MGKSNPSRKLRKAVCLECRAKCEAYLKNGNSPYPPTKSHKVRPEYRENPSLLYQFCRHYDSLKNIKLS